MNVEAVVGLVAGTVLVLSIPAFVLSAGFMDRLRSVLRR